MSARDENALPANTPLVTVVIPTYNYSSVLKYAIESVLWQTFQDFELWVIGDGCTDDSELVVQSFGDPRIHWHNLPENSGGQSIPNNTGIQFARGKYIAYLGHDDLWYPTHLRVLVDALETSGADAAHSLILLMHAEGPKRQLLGIFASGQYQPFTPLPPVSVMHRRSMAEDIGGWKDYRTLRIPTDIDFMSRAALAGKQFISVAELTAFKFPAASHKNVYVDKPTHEQSAYADRIQHERDFLYHELLAVTNEWEPVRRAYEATYHSRPPLRQPGEWVEMWRAYRGLAPNAPAEAPDLVEDLIALMDFNRREDITPAWCRNYLQANKKLPKNGVLLGAGWHALEHDEVGLPLRWIETDAEILLTELDQRPWLLSLKLRPGYANDDQPVTVALIGPQGETVDKILVDQQARVFFHIPEPAQATVKYILRVLDSRNKSNPPDPRILNFGVYALQLDSVGDARSLISAPPDAPSEP